MKHLIITIIGKDRSGLVELLSDTVFQNNGNWLSSSLSKLAGQFAGILQVEVAPEDMPQLSAALAKIDELQINIVEEAKKAAPVPLLHQLTITGNDRPGIVKEVTTLLSQLNININILETETQSAPNWGYPIFIANFQLEIPANIDLDIIQDELEKLADDLTVDIEDYVPA